MIDIMAGGMSATMVFNNGTPPTWNVRDIDYPRDNTVVSRSKDVATNRTDYATFNTAWNAGLSVLGQEVKTGLGAGGLVCGNVAIPVSHGVIDGCMFELSAAAGTFAGEAWADWVGFNGDTYDAFFHRYTYRAWSDTEPNLAIIMAYEGAGNNTFATPPNYKLMRFYLCTTLMGGGYFVYAPDLWTAQNDTDLEWFDEYDGGALATKGYLGQPTADPAVVPTKAGVYTRTFEGGIVVINTTAAEVADIPLGGTYSKLDGSQDATHNDGSTGNTTVTLAAYDAIIMVV
jgi:hypothetical protein